MGEASLSMSYSDMSSSYGYLSKIKSYHLKNCWNLIFKLFSVIITLCVKQIYRSVKHLEVIKSIKRLQNYH